MLIPFLGQGTTSDAAKAVLNHIISKGNAKEVFLKCLEGMQNITWQRETFDETNEDNSDLAVPVSLINLEGGSDPLLQTIALYNAARECIMPPIALLIEVLKRIRTARPSRFLTTFAAALLTNLTNAFRSIIDTERLETLHNLMLDFVTYCLDNYYETSEKDKGLAQLLQGVITTYVPIFMGNQMVYWSGRYWEETHTIPSGRIQSEELVNKELNIGLVKLEVTPSQG